MFTQKKVQTVSDCAKKFSGNVFGLQAIGGDIGSGVRYIDGREQLVWLGSRGAREAASYYLGIADTYNVSGNRADLPPDVETVRDELIGNGLNKQWYERGTSTAQSWLRHNLTDHTFSLADLQAIPVLTVGQADNVLLNHGGIKVSLSHTAVADGAPYDNQVTVQKNSRNGWQTIREYQAK